MQSIKNNFPVFEANQVLTNEHLNMAINYLDEQERLTRANLIGIGIVCGLEIKLISGSGMTIQISKGCGITSQGYLIVEPEDMNLVSYRADYLLPAELDYPAFKDQKNKQYPLWELFPAGEQDTKLLNSASFLENMAVLLFLELKKHSLRDCSPSNCDDKGSEVAASIKPLLIEKANLDKIIAEEIKLGSGLTPGELESALLKQLNLPDLQLPRFIIPSIGPVESGDIFKAYLDLFRTSKLVGSTAKALKASYMAFRPLLQEAFPEDPFSDFEARYGFLENTPAAPNQVRFLQYYYDLFDDLLCAYQEFRWKAMELACACCPPGDLFPRHLMLGLLYPGKSGNPGNYRQHFLASPVGGRCSMLSKEALDLFKRLVEMTRAFTDVPALPELPVNVKYSSDPQIRITPSRLGDASLSGKAVPYYYKQDGSPPLYQQWNMEKTRRNRANQNLSYRYDEYVPAAPAFISNPLNYDLEPYNFLRIEGCLGKDYFSVLNTLLSAKSRYRLPIEIIALRAGAFDQNAPVDISKDQCRFQDLEALYDAQRETLRSFLAKELTLFYDLPVSEEDPSKKAVRSIVPVLIKYRPDFLVKANRLGALFERQYQQQVFASELMNVVSSTLHTAFYRIIYRIVKLDEVLTENLADVNFDNLAQRYRELEEAAQELEIKREQWFTHLEGAASILRAEEIDDRLEDLFFNCQVDAFQSIRTEYRRRIHELKQKQFLAYFLQKHPGIQHKAGVPVGGTYVIVYHQDPAPVQVPDTHDIISSGPAVASWSVGRLDIFIRGADNALWHKWFDGKWSEWETLGGLLTSDPAAVSWSKGRIDVFVRGTDYALWHKWFDEKWSRWESLGGDLSSGPAVASWASGRLDVFARGSDNALWHKWFDGKWREWESLGGVLTSDPAAVSWSKGRIDVFVRGTDNALWHKWFDGKWQEWESLGGDLSSGPAVSSWVSGRLDVFVRGTDNALWHKWFDGKWSAWESLGGVLTSDPAAVSWGKGRIDAFARGVDSALWHKWFDGKWYGWESLGGALNSNSAFASRPARAALDIASMAPKAIGKLESLVKNNEKAPTQPKSAFDMKNPAIPGELNEAISRIIGNQVLVLNSDIQIVLGLLADRIPTLDVKLPVVEPADPLTRIISATVDGLADGTVIADFFLPYICCSDCTPVQFALHKPPPTFSVQISCTNAKQYAEVTVKPLGGLAPYSVKVDDHDYQLLNGPLSLGAGPHTLLVRDADATESSPLTISIAPQLTLGEPKYYCTENNQYFAEIVINGGAPPYMADGLQVTGNVFKTKLVDSGTAAIVEVTDKNQCAARMEVKYKCKQPVTLAGHIGCTNSEGYAEVTVEPKGGDAPYRISIDGKEYKRLDGALSLQAGSHTLVICDKNETKSAPQTIVIEAPVTIGKPVYTCSQNGESYTAAFSITGGTPPYSSANGTVGADGVLTTFPPIKSGEAAEVVVYDFHKCSATTKIQYTCPQPCTLPCKGIALRRGFCFSLPGLTSSKRFSSLYGATSAVKFSFEFDYQKGDRIETIVASGAVQTIYDRAAGDNAKFALELNKWIDEKTGSPGWLKFIPPSEPQAVLDTWWIEYYECLKFELIVTWSHRVTIALVTPTLYTLTVTHHGSSFVQTRGDNILLDISIPAFDGYKIDKCNNSKQKDICTGSLSIPKIKVENIKGPEATLRVEHSNDLVAFLWEVGPDGTPPMANSDTVTFTFTGTGDKQIRVTAFTDKGCQVTRETTIKISQIQ